EGQGFEPSLEWDVTATGAFRKPIGLAADGEARIFMKLAKSPSNTKQVSSIQATLTPLGNAYSGPALLGKIMYATQTETYSDEANAATATSVTYLAAQQNNSAASEYRFWLVAPDDFTTDLDEVASERHITATFIFTYTDNSVETVVFCRPISIFRPALVFVHGMFSDPNSWKSTAYITSQSDTTTYIHSTEWRVVQRINLYEKAFLE